MKIAIIVLVVVLLVVDGATCFSLINYIKKHENETIVVGNEIYKQILKRMIIMLVVSLGVGVLGILAYFV